MEGNFLPLTMDCNFRTGLSWLYGVAFLALDRWGGQASVSQPWVENQWGFGQLLATIIVFLPALPLLELWSGESGLFLMQLKLNLDDQRRC
jgi:hypothetical protein